LHESLTDKHRREIEQQKEKYERMLQELRNNASNDKEFIQMELKRRITELEQEILNLKAKFADEMEQISEKMAQARNEFEL
jgi:hypothetical protein